MLSRYTLILCALACITFWGTISLSAFASFPLSIIEVQTEGIRANDEFIQLKNTAALSQDLTGFKILHKIYSQTKDICSEETLVTPSRFSHKSILGNGSFLIAHPDYAVFHPLDPPADLVYPVSNTLTKNTMEIVLLDAQGRILDTHVLGTLCEIQDVPEESPSSLPMTGAIRINEIFPNPDTPQDVGEYIELYNLSDTDIDLSGWQITDATKTGDYTFPSKTSLPATDISSLMIPIFLSLSIMEKKPSPSSILPVRSSIPSPITKPPRVPLSTEPLPAGARAGHSRLWHRIS